MLQEAGQKPKKQDLLEADFPVYKGAAIQNTKPYFTFEIKMSKSQDKYHGDDDYLT